MFGQTKIVEVEPGTEVKCPETQRKLVVTDSEAIELGGTLFVTPVHAAALKSIVDKGTSKRSQ